MPTSPNIIVVGETKSGQRFAITNMGNCEFIKEIVSRCPGQIINVIWRDNGNLFGVITAQEISLATLGELRGEGKE